MRPTSMLAPVLLSVGAVLVAPAIPAHAETALETIAALEAAGYTVNIDRVGSAPLEECVVTSVRNPQTVTELARVEHRDGPFGFGGDGDDHGRLVPVVVSRSISVSLNCAG
ncbi:hypothetical protein AU195_00850 [Mycobacterium sp. IS-1496]|uniref:hypothetical protein n=1 Tax=Mycobacterium sp. IS-1496 TaxID=1772284 RepID=UPI00074150A2|nr:hypothetical protein [Mycobacterium sp. IS-1496]KUI30297.1 hypothetical protein AU195_00850 [Mycobacterium sp. IS-1496]